MIAGFAPAPDRHSKVVPITPRLDYDEALVLENMDLVRSVALRIAATLPRHVDRDDLIQTGTIGLIDAARKFDPSKAVTFSAYAKHRIRGAILDSLRQQDPVSREIRAHQKKIDATAVRLEKELNREPTEPEIASALSMDVHRLRMIQLHLAASNHISASTSASDDLPDPEHPDSPEGSPEHLCARKQMVDLLEKAVAKLPERQREVIRLYYADEMTMKEVGKRLSVNESRASQIHRVAINFVGEQLRASGVRSVA